MRPQQSVEDIYLHSIVFYPSLLEKCMLDVMSRRAMMPDANATPIDLRVFVQRDKDTHDNSNILTPVFIIKFSKEERYVYMHGEFAYALKGRVSIQYYDCVTLRKLPRDWEHDKIRLLTA